MNIKKVLVVGLMTFGIAGGFSAANAAGHEKRASSETAVSLPVNINTGIAAQLKAVKNGLGEKKATAIVAYRTEHGNFKSVNDLKNIKGFSPKVLGRLEGKLTV